MINVVAGAVISGGRLLLAQRTYPESVAGLWELPGGKVDPGETRAEALRRELHEELAIEVEPGEQIGEPVPLPGGMQLVAIAAKLLAGDPRPTEHAAVRWVDAVQLQAMTDLVPADAIWMPDLAVLLSTR